MPSLTEEPWPVGPREMVDYPQLGGVAWTRDDPERGGVKEGQRRG